MNVSQKDSLKWHKDKEIRVRKKYNFIMIILFVVFVMSIFVSFVVGYYPLTPTEVMKAAISRFGYEGEVLPQAVTIFWNIRLPRILSAVFIGASLSVAGGVYQGMFRNPLVSPDILGVSSGASLGAAIAIITGQPNWKIQIAAFCGGIMAVSFSYFISRKSTHSQILSLVLTGSMVMALCNAGVTMIKYVANPNDVLQQIVFWLMGSLTKVTMQGLTWSVVPMLIGLLAIFVLRWQLNLLTLDEEEAKSLGVNIKAYRIIFIIASTLLSAAAVCLGGLIGWIGLMIPHMSRSLVGSDYKRLIPTCALLGATYLLIMDDIARSVLTIELPIGVVTSILGAPFFIYLILKRKG
jgi:ABC-type Fe3+-siderophore transport system, permease component